jgi:hypothetical protein
MEQWSGAGRTEVWCKNLASSFPVTFGPVTFGPEARPGVTVILVAPSLLDRDRDDMNKVPVPAAGFFRAVALGVDGTLAQHNRVEIETLAAVRQVIARGLTVIAGCSHFL